MRLFFDTSALVKYFHEEEGSDRVDELIADAKNEVWVVELVRLEFMSALCRRFRNGDLDEHRLNEALAGFEETLASFRIEPLSRSVLMEAEGLLKRYATTAGLRSLDALHLAAFAMIADEESVFVAADGTLCTVAGLMGFQTINPIESSE